ncbi:MAG: single-stranded DNA-binding protein [Bacteroidetes bacterium]|jgi:single-strand DNA-binding protein|nr:single-stranded DNA-binding protein [Bacteroidota bacterium]HQW46041.1 single-stranded DNA-binding protein [Chitinophagaceae bacterium]MBK6818449.1 single-stranded DNA-binding protein [Bacteroidota bacterium]MBK7040731.1 single-stranded DNA-binding protein [Bacteroidota bacterium]MBK7588430.1 single-stranded DNA-binding protein [Bacteroidota bacterium]
MRGVNHVFLIGNLGKDPEIQYIEGNIPVAKFPLATTETFKDKKGNTIPQTEWHNIVLWRGLAELAAKYLHKGSLVHIEGSLRTRSWEDKDKNRRFMTEIIASNLVMLDKRNTGDVKHEHEDHPNLNTVPHIDSSLPLNTDDLESELPF